MQQRESEDTAIAHSSTFTDIFPPAVYFCLQRESADTLALRNVLADAHLVDMLHYRKR